MPDFFLWHTISVLTWDQHGTNAEPLVLTLGLEAENR